MALYIGRRKVCPAHTVYRGAFNIRILGFAGTDVECNGTTLHIGSNETVTFTIIQPGIYTFTATRDGKTKTETITINDSHGWEYTVSMFIGMQYVEYLESTGTQWIDTGYAPNNNSGLELVYFARKADNPRPAFVIDNNTQYKDSFGIVSSGSVPMQIYNGQNGGGQSNIWMVDSIYGSGTGIYTLVINGQNASITAEDGVTLTHTFNPYTYQLTPTLYLFAANDSGTTILPAQCKIYECKLYDEGILIHDFKPIIDDTGHGAMYDAVTEQVYYNSGSGDFIVGPKKPYTKVEYLESTGTQWIDTGFHPNNLTTTKIELTTAISSGQESDWVGNGISSQGGTGFFMAITNDNRFVYNDGTDHVTNVSAPSRTLPYTYTYDGPNSKFMVKSSGLSLVNVDTAVVEAKTKPTFALFGFNNANSDHSVRVVKQKIYGCKIYSDGDLIHFFVPVLDYDNVPALHDIVEDVLYYNNGTGNFVAGPLAGHQELEYIQTTGVEYIDTNTVVTGNTRFEVDTQLIDSSYDGYNIIGSGGGSDNSFASIRAGRLSGYSKYTFIRNQVNYTPGDIYIDKDRHYFVMDIYHSIVHIDEYELNTGSWAGGNNYELYFGIYNSLGSISTQFSWIGKYYEMKVYDRDVLIRDFIPVRRLADNVVCFYDKVEDKYYTNLGSGTFIGGPVKQ